MRMWMVDPRVMCRQHLLGEHVELHMFVGHLRRGRGIDGFIAHNCVEPRSLERRHAALVRELQRRGYNHRSPLLRLSVRVVQRYSAVRVDRLAAKTDLLGRCRECRKRLLKARK